MALREVRSRKAIRNNGQSGIDICHLWLNHQWTAGGMLRLHMVVMSPDASALRISALYNTMLGQTDS